MQLPVPGRSQNFCKSCGTKLKATLLPIACPACGHTNRAASRFCAKCGDAFRGSAEDQLHFPATVIPAGPEASTRALAHGDADKDHQWHGASSNERASGNPGRKGLATGAVTILVVLLVGGIGYWVWAAKRDADARHHEEARLESEKQRTLEEEAKRRDLERQRLLKWEEDAREQAERIRIEAENARANEDARVAAEAQTKTEAKSRAAAPSRTALEEAKGAATEQVNRPAVQPEPQKPTEPSRHEAFSDRATTFPRPVRQTAQQLCANRSNLVTRVICEAQQCAKPEHSEEAFCKQGREAQAGERRRDAGY